MPTVSQLQLRAGTSANQLWLGQHLPSPNCTQGWYLPVLSYSALILLLAIYSPQVSTTYCEPAEPGLVLPLTSNNPEPSTYNLPDTVTCGTYCWPATVPRPVPSSSQLHPQAITYCTAVYLQPLR
jgi:hypothetical protein